MKNCWSLKLSEVGLLYVISFSSVAQFSEPERALPAGEKKLDYLFPIEAGKTAMLTGTMGELRNTHFHGGLDINTPTIGFDVRAAGDGYILRATTSTSGYGNCLQVKHPSGQITLYAHLNEFVGELGAHVRKERYRRKQSEIDLTFAPADFPVKKGDLIALSGNTGSSGGPHLHFELRSNEGEAINPLVAGFPEVQDHLPPLVQKIALKTLTPDSRINDQFGRFEFYVQKQGDTYFLSAPILATGTIGIEVLAYDRQENSRFKFGINTIEMLVNGKKEFVQKIDKIRFSENRSILALMDYRSLELKGVRYNKLYVDDGNRLPYYEGSTSSRGALAIGKEPIDISIRLVDYFENVSFINLKMQPSPLVRKSPFIDPLKRALESEVMGNTLKVSAQRCAGGDSTLRVFQKGKMSTLTPTYSGPHSNIYLLDLRSELPDSVTSCGGRWISNWVGRIPSNTEYTYFSENVEIDFPANALYDTLALSLRVRADSATQRESISIGSETVPLFQPIRVTYQPQTSNVNPARNVGVYRKEGGGYAYLGNNWKNGRYSFQTLSFGEFTFLQDSIAPVIKPIAITSAVARLRIKDDLSGIAYFEANINGQWLLMNYDYKTGILFSERLDTTKPLQGEFELKVVDQAGNESIHKHKIL